MATKFIVDTHALVWHLEGKQTLGRKAKAVIDSPSSELVLPVIALAEAVFIVEKGRTSIPGVSDLLNDVLNDPRIEIYPLNVEILQESLTLAAIPEMHDRLIVATGIYLQSLGETVKIITKDNEIILASLLPVVWS
jgi:PIN domain nuclease of toxin-antitoxin system